MQAFARVKWRFRRSAVVVSLRDDPKFGDFVVSCIPCFATGFHTFGLKIAAAALRPRNDTNLERFCFGNGRFCFMRPFFARWCSAPLFKRFVPKTVSFSSKPDQICHCEEGACARRGNL